MRRCRAIDAIKEGGISVLEITMTVPGAVKVIEEVVKRYGADATVGAGTVLDPETARACILAGAQFIVSPALNLDTIALCRRYSVPIMPGVLTPTEVITAWSAGADFVKVFPCRFCRRRKLYQKPQRAAAADQDHSDRRCLAKNGRGLHQGRARVLSASGLIWLM